MRKETVARILAMDHADRTCQQEAIESFFFDLSGFANAETVLLYVSAFPEEIATKRLLEISREMGKRVLCPRVDRVRGLRLFEVTEGRSALVPGAMGIPEPRLDLPEIKPDQVDWALVPGITFDVRGYRLGRGKGYYDRLLPSLRPDAVSWALAFDPQWVDAVPVEPHDHPLHGIASPGRRYERAAYLASSVITGGDANPR